MALTSRKFRIPGKPAVGLAAIAFCFLLAGCSLQSIFSKATPVQARQGCRVTGVVSDVVAGVVPNAIVLVEGAAVSATADALGRFSVDALTPGTYELVASVPGHVSYRQSITVVDAPVDAGVIWVYREPVPPPTYTLYVQALNGSGSPSLFWLNNHDAYQGVGSAIALPNDAVSGWVVYEGVYMVHASGFGNNGAVSNLVVREDTLLTLDFASGRYTAVPTKPLQMSKTATDARYQSLVRFVNRSHLQVSISLGDATKTLDGGQSAVWRLGLGTHTMVKCDYNGCQIIKTFPVSYPEQTMELYTTSSDTVGYRFQRK